MTKARLALAAASLLASGCTTTPSQPRFRPLVGTEWRLLEFESSADEIGTIRPARGEVYTLTLNRDGSAAMQLFCNRGTGRWTSPDSIRSSGSITIELSAQTMAACPPSRLERIAADMGRVRSFVITNGRLHLNLMLSGGNYVFVPS
jgi:heat shock protein HslJ